MTNGLDDVVSIGPIDGGSTGSRSEHLVRGVGDVEKAVLVVVLPIDFGDRFAQAGHALVVDDQVEGLVLVQLHSVPIRTVRGLA